MENRIMMSKHNQTALINRLKNRFLRAAVLALVMASMTVSPVLVAPSLAQEQGSKDQSQQTPAVKAQSSALVEDGSSWERHTAEVANQVGLQAATIPLAFTSTQFFAQVGNNEVTLTGLPAGSRAASVWITEGVNNLSHIGSAVFTTSSVQLSQDGTRIRV